MHLTAEGYKHTMGVMKHATPVFFGFAMCVSATLFAQEPQLVWSDEFDAPGAYPDAGKWSYQTGGGGWGNGEQQYYTNRRDENANAYIQDGVLIIEARVEDFGNNAYTSARLNSTASWKYGRFIIRARLPHAVGTWPAIWMMPTDSVYGGWPRSGEIDIMEHVGSDVNNVHSSLHTEAQNHTLGNGRTGAVIVPTSTTEFHDYQIDWTPEYIAAYVDGNRYFFARNGNLDDPTLGSPYWPFDQRFHLILNVALGGSWGGSYINDSALPQRLEIDWVRVYDLGDGEGITWSEVPGRLEAEDFANASGVQIETTQDTEGVSNVGWFNEGDWIDYRIDVAHSGFYDIQARYASMYGNADFTLTTARGATVHATGLAATGAWQAWETADLGTVFLDKGQQTIRLSVNPMVTVDDFNLNYFDIQPGNNPGPDGNGWGYDDKFGWYNSAMGNWTWMQALEQWTYVVKPPVTDGGWAFIVRPNAG